MEVASDGGRFEGEELMSVMSIRTQLRERSLERSTARYFWYSEEGDDRNQSHPTSRCHLQPNLQGRSD
eukprot:2662980-Rhodomonas_salina.2